MSYLDDAIRTAIRRATLESVEDGGSQQTIRARGLKSEQFDKIHRPQPFGFSASPPAGSEGLILALGGRSDRAVALGFEHRQHRPISTESGGTKIYDANGNVISLVQAAVRIVGTAEVRIVAPKIILEGFVDLGGEGGMPVDRTDNNPSAKVKAI